ncbi:AMP-binding protein [Nocardioides sp.]|uniref:AMP-binding protein n=1 Tax=Nocardioides sp. TaxID=35761 RepID=UPI002ED281E6
MASLLTSPEVLVQPRVLDLRAHGDHTAIHTASDRLTYAELADRVDETASLLGATRRLVLVEGRNTVESLTTYLAALTHGHVVMLAPPGDPARRLADAWDPDVVAGEAGLRERREGTAHDLHPDLALLLSTSGSTGSPKLVRLSHDNLRANAASIAEYLGLTPADRALTSLPMHYCYGLSVVHSHLLVGAGLVLTDLSVVDECFWRLAESREATSFAGVPYTFEQLECSGFADRALPSLRYITQAGGRMPPERVARWRDVGRRAGWDLVVMYGQTEATARMAWLPPDLADAHPDAVGIPIPGGSFRIEPVADISEPGVGELVYEGPNVMQGYADRPADLARGAELVELRTGDLAREVDGLVRIVGRRGRHSKLFGLRIDLDHLEAQVDAEVHCVVVDDALHAFTDRPRTTERLARALAAASGLPPSAIRVTALSTLPRTTTGKPDRGALAAHARLLDRAGGSDDGPPTPELLREEYAVVLGRPDAATTDSFVDLGGDSLSYVEFATRLTERLGDLPTDWHTRPIADLATAAQTTRTGSRLDTSVVLRAAAIVLIVGSHANLWMVMGGAHLLLAVAGWNFARFQLSAETRVGRLRHGLTSLGQLVVPTSLWLGLVGIMGGYYAPATVGFLNQALGPDDWSRQWQFWFLEAMVWTSLLVLVLLAVPAVDRLERRAPYGFALVAVLTGLAVRFTWVGLEASGGTSRYTIGVVAWWFLVGWLAVRADTSLRRWTVVVLTAVGTLGYFGDLSREVLVIGGIALLVHVPVLRVPRRLVAPISTLASASLFIYITHWVVYPPLEDSVPALATLLSLAVGIGYWRLMRPLQRHLGRLAHQA